MEQSNNLEQLLRGLSTPRRNHYFYGKLMDVCHFEMEQTYVNHKRWLINQQSLGSGVLCGLNVRSNEGKLWVEPGMAIDGYGREIIMPVRAGIDPWTLTDACGKAASELSREERHMVTLLICYRECLTDYMPVLVSDCGGEEDTAAATLVETFQLAVREGLPDLVRPALDPLCCRAMFPDPDQEQPSGPDTSTDSADPKDTLRSIERMRSNLCECADDPCPMPEEPCLALAVIELLPGGKIGGIEACRYRQRLYSNQVLFELILCLAARLDACCKEPGGQDQIPPKVASVQVFDIHNDLLAELAEPAEVLAFERKQLVGSVRVLFTQPLLPASVVAGGAGDDPGAQSFLVVKDQAGLVAGRLKFEDQRTVRWFPDTDAVETGAYTVQLFGNGNVNSGRPPIVSTDGVRLDGEPDGLPSGDDAEGGIFEFRFRIADEVDPKEPPQVTSVTLMSREDGVLAIFGSPGEVPETDVADHPRSIRVEFTAGIASKSLVAGDDPDDPRPPNFLLTEVDKGPVRGRLIVERPDRIRWAADDQPLTAGAYTLSLFGDPDQSGRIAISGIDGQRLDGEPGKAFPSGNGAEGGVFRVKFNVIIKRGPGE